LWVSLTGPNLLEMERPAVLPKERFEEGVLIDSGVQLLGADRAVVARIQRRTILREPKPVAGHLPDPDVLRHGIEVGELCLLQHAERLRELPARERRLPHDRAHRHAVEPDHVHGVVEHQIRPE
jgi:hypothetical protein